MAVDPRKTWGVKGPKVCKKGTAHEAAKTNNRKDALRALAGIEGTGKVGEGLRALVGISDSIRVDGEGNPLGAVSEFVGKITNSVDGAFEQVFEVTGLDTVVDKVASFKPDVFNRAANTARGIQSKVKDGDFKFTDIPDVFSDLQNMENMGRNIFGSEKKPPKRELYCAASPFAVDLIAQAPKFNFMFVAEIKFTPAYSALSKVGKSTAFVVKQSTRPAVNFEYDDVNMYNFWTKVPKKTEYQPMNMTFYDDNKNAVQLLYNTYLKAMSPIANDKPKTAQNGTIESDSMNFTKRDSVNLTDGDISTASHNASLGALLENSTAIIETIRLYHIFDYGNLMNIYNFYNPRILTMTPSELNMTDSGEGGSMEFQFAYDKLVPEAGWSLASDRAASDGIPKLDELTLGGGEQYPINQTHGGQYDANFNSQQSLAPYIQASLDDSDFDTLELQGFDNSLDPEGASALGVFNPDPVKWVPDDASVPDFPSDEEVNQSLRNNLSRNTNNTTRRLLGVDEVDDNISYNSITKPWLSGN